MKINIDNDLVFELSETKKKVLCYDIPFPELEAEIKRRLEWVISQKFEECFKRLKLEWDPKLAARGIEMIPTNPEKYAELVFSQEDYQCRMTREQQ